MGKIIGLAMVGVVLVGGFLYWNSQGGKEGEPQSLQATEATATKTPEKGMISSIKEAMGLGTSMQCTYSLKEGGNPIESKVVVEGEKYRSTTMVGTMTVEALFDGEHQYVWTSATKMGTKMSKGCLAKMAELGQKMAESVPTMSEPQDMRQAFDAAEGVRCEPVSRGDFTLPTDIAFTDHCALMESSMEMMKEMKDKLPAGMSMPDISNMMAQ